MMKPKLATKTIVAPQPITVPTPRPIQETPKTFISKITENENRLLRPISKVDLSFLRFDTIDSVGVKATFVSKVDAALYLGMKYRLSEKFDLNFGGRLRFFLIENPPDFAGDKESAFLHAFSLGTVYRLDENRQLSFQVKRSREAYIRGLSSSRYTIETADVIGVQAGIEYFLAKLSSGPVSLSLEGTGFLPAALPSYKSKMGYGFCPTFIYKPLLKGNHVADLTLGYQYVTKDTELYQLTEQSLTLGLGIAW